MQTQNMRIAIIGTHGTGKTTLAKMLSGVFNIPILEECARNYDIKHASPEKYLKIQKNILIEQIATESKHPSFVSDRSTIDNLAYWIHSCAQMVDASMNKKYINTSMENAKKYTVIFLLVPEFYPMDDGFRDTNLIFQLQIAETINTILHLYQIPHYILRGTVDERLQRAIDIINETKQK
ncbi:MAG: ATP-binding protein [Candidatus Methanoperedens sp.]